MNLLILNDEVITAETMKEEIDWKQYGIDQVWLAFNVEQAKKVLTEENVDIALCDIEMPGENGIAFLKWMKETGKDTECIFLTCHASFAYAQDAIRYGCQDYILMPAKYEDIGKSIYKVVMRRTEAKKTDQLSEYGKQWLHDKSEAAMEEQGDKLTPKEVIEKSVYYIRNRIRSQQLSVDEVANYCHLNAIYLNRIFKKEKGISISQFIIKEKMELAGRLLETPGMSAQNVADKVGYPNYPHFSTMFKKYYGCSPAQYQKQKNES